MLVTVRLGQSIVVPLAHIPSLVSCRGKGPGQSRQAFVDGAARTENAISNAGTTGQQFGTTVHTDRIGAGCSRERAAATHESIERRSLNDRIAERRDRVGSLIVR